jgi:hypothetical protein
VEDLKIGKELGRGAFGIISEGHYKGDSVAVKKLILEMENEEELLRIFSEFRREVSIMRFVGMRDFLFLFSLFFCLFR